MSSKFSRRDAVRLLIGTVGVGSWSSLVGCERRHGFRMQAPWINDAEFIGYFVANDLGYYNDEGLDFEYLSGGPEIIVEPLLIESKAEIALAPIETTASLVRDGADLVIVGAQYQKSPLGIVSLASTPVSKPADLVGKTLAVPTANRLTVDALLRLNGVSASAVTIVPYQYDPTPLVKREVDATVDFVTNVPFSVEQAGEKAHSFLFHNFGLKIFNDVVVVKRSTLRSRAKEVAAWMRASRRGWQENFRDPTLYPSRFASTWFEGTGRTVQNEIFFNRAQRDLIEHPEGIYTLSGDSMRENLASLAEIGIGIDATLFDPRIVESL